MCRSAAAIPLKRFVPNHKSFTRFFSKNRRVQGQSPGRPPQRAKSQFVHSAIRRWRNSGQRPWPSPPPHRGGWRGPFIDDGSAGTADILHTGTMLRIKGRRPPPALGWGRRPYGLRRGDCAICGWRFGTLGVFRAVRGAGISPAAAGDRGFAPGPQNFFEKKFSKSFFFFTDGGT